MKVRFDGTELKGWARQKNTPETVQGEASVCSTLSLLALELDHARHVASIYAFPSV